MGSVMPWYRFDSEEEFTTWHEEVKQRLGYPLPSRNSDGEIVGEPYTTDYTTVIKISDSDWRAFVEENHAQGLTESEEPVFEDKRIKEN